MTRIELIKQIRKKQSFLCVGLDSDLSKIPQHLLVYDDPIFEFNKRVIDATKDACVAYKPNIAFYECMGPKGWESLAKTLDYIPSTHFTIADAKRADIGNTSKKYAQTFFEHLNFDAVTIAPYMGIDSVQPFLEYEGKWVILLALTSNKGSRDFQFLETNGTPIYQKVMETAQSWGTPDQLMFVTGATHPEKFEDLRTIAPNHFFLVPGIGAQGGDLQSVAQYGLNKDVGLLINSSRGIIYAGSGEDFEKAVAQAANKIHQEMKLLLK